MPRYFHSIVLLLACLIAAPTATASGTIRNDRFWLTVEGTPIYSQGGGIFRFHCPQTGRERYFWYGVRYAEAVRYAAQPTSHLQGCTFEAVTCYVSDDLVTWTTVGDVLTRDEVAQHCRVGWLGRMGVARVADAGCYALLIQCDNSVLFATADTPTDPFHWHRRKDMKSLIGTHNTGDQTVFTDPDTGRSYLIYSYGNGRDKGYVSEIGLRGDSIDLMDCTEVFRGASREGNCMFKYAGRYYLCASNIYGWNASLPYYLVSDDIRGPYLPANDMQVIGGSEADYAHVTQTGFFVDVRGTEQETIVYCGDRWTDFASNGLGYNQWLPMSFDGAKPLLHSLSEWELDARTGRWSVGRGNNYVLNPSFDADRQQLPSTNKPRQEHITGWQTTVLRGHAIVAGDTASPRLNQRNTAADREHVTGKFALCITDAVPFERHVSQRVAGTPGIPLPQATYTLRCNIRTTAQAPPFTTIYMYARTAAATRRASLRPTTTWQAFELHGITVDDGEVEVGFHAAGPAGAECYIDDVELTRD